MEEIITCLEESLVDDLLTKSEKKSLKSLVADHLLDQDQLNFLRSKIYELAKSKATVGNYRFIIDWIKDANSALLARPQEKSEAFFSPGETCRNTIIHQLGQSITRIKICVFTISDDQITDAIITSHKRGVDIKIITDNDKSLDIGSDIERLSKAGIPVKMDNTSNHMHHKFMVVDDHTLITGSYNWTQSAARFNHENILLTREGGVVKLFLRQFEKLWGAMSPYQ